MYIKYFNTVDSTGFLSSADDQSTVCIVGNYQQELISSNDPCECSSFQLGGMNGNPEDNANFDAIPDVYQQLHQIDSEKLQRHRGGGEIYSTLYGKSY